MLQHYDKTMAWAHVDKDETGHAVVCVSTGSVRPISPPPPRHDFVALSSLISHFLIKHLNGGKVDPLLRFTFINVAAIQQWLLRMCDFFMCVLQRALHAATYPPVWAKVLSLCCSVGSSTAALLSICFFLVHGVLAVSNL